MGRVGKEWLTATYLDSKETGALPQMGKRKGLRTLMRDHEKISFSKEKDAIHKRLITGISEKRRRF